MKAVIVHGPRDLRVEEAPESPAVPGVVAVDIAYDEICGSDLHYWQHGRNGSFEVRELLILGHEELDRRTAALAGLAIEWHGIDREAGYIEGAHCFVSRVDPIGLLAAAVL